MNAFFKELLEYNHHFNQELVKEINDHLSQVSEKSIQLLNHILNAHHIWNNRIEGTQPSLSVWGMSSFEALRGIDQANFERSQSLLGKVDLDTMISYATSKGEPFQTSIRDILFHVINHSTHHRGQIVSDLRQSGIAPPITDYIFYKR